MKFEYLMHLLTVLECGSISKAADKLYMSQPALTKEINLVEDELGIQLFVRSNKGVVPTRQSEDFFKEVPAVLTYYSSWKKSKKDTALESVNIAVSEQLCQLIFSDVLLRMHKNNQSVDMCIQELGRQEIFNSLSMNTHGLAIIAGLPEEDIMIREKAESLNCAAELLYRDNYYVFMNSRHELAEKKEICLADLKTSILALYSNASAFLYDRFFSDGFWQKLLLPNTDMITTILDNDEKAVAFWSKLIVRDALRIKNNSWICRQLKDFPMPFSHYVLYPRKKFVSPAAKAVLDEIRKWYGMIERC